MLMGVERRAAERSDEPSVHLPRLTGRIRSGHQVRIVNLSAAGVLIESHTRLLPGAAVDLHLEWEQGRHQSRGRVVRAYVSEVLPHALLFRAGVSLEQPIDAATCQWTDRGG